MSLIWQRKRQVALMNLKPRGIRHSLHCRVNDSDFAVLRQVIGKKEVAFPLRDRPSTIIDGGANVGYASILFANLWPDSRIIAIEPDPVNYEILLSNTSPYPNIECFQAAIWPVEESLTIANPEDASFEFRVAPAADGTGQLSGMTISQIQERAGFSNVDLLKLDIEGAEYDLFREGCPSWVNCVKTIAVELQDRFRPGCTQKVFDALTGFEHSTHGEYDVFSRQQ